MSTSETSAGAALPARRARGLVTAGALAVVLVVGLAACGSGSGKPAAAASTTSTTIAGRGRFGAAFAAFSSCMSQHGVKLQLPQRTGNGPRPTGPRPTGEAGGTPGSGFRGGGGFFRPGSTPSSLPPGVTASQYQSAMSACRSKLPTGGFGGGARGGAATAAYRSCMSDHGVTLPSFGGFGSSSSSTTASSSPPTTFDRTSPKFVAANKICMALLPARGGTTTTTAG